MTDDYIISTDKSRLDLNLVHQFLSQESYWAKNMPMELVRKAVDNSLCFGVYLADQQVGFARVITDYTTFAYLSDVFVVKEHRGKGLSKRLVQYIVDYPDLQGLRRWTLVTVDAHTLYEQFGFTFPDDPKLYMQRKLIDSY
ncbi:GNAT family N-acetyltransferase [Spirosoma rhododendri]|uniref:GNAT family N-acetyltransferase n=1 Tax=Spirosoma rhododendri TaxID=2728024 RepID=A0A7L5DHY4_9BACT|nr:GNAT family N-acetyltransferase [Spirosoma rhododendri]QJD77929.1 GNAT family N-acetyltransferase [Spirosoma rhododendri]